MLGLAMTCSTNVDRTLVTTSAAQSEEELVNAQRMLGLLDALCVCIDEELSGGNAPHSSNAPVRWLPATECLLKDDAEELRALKEGKVLWCLARIMDCIHTGQMLESFSAELASGMYTQAHAVLDDFGTSSIVVHQDEPAPFVVHLRTLLYGFCLTYPFSLAAKGACPASILAIQFAVSFSMLGIDGCAREMDYPLGDDAGDIPIRQICAKTRDSIASVWEHNACLCPTSLREDTKMSRLKGRAPSFRPKENSERSGQK